MLHRNVGSNDSGVKTVLPASDGRDADKVLLIVHQKTSVPGRVGALLAERGYVLDQRCPCVGKPLPESLDEYAGVVVFGGPMSANDCQRLEGIKEELVFLERVLEEEVPFLGICLGGQMLARVIGGSVSPHPEGRIESGYFRITPTESAPAFFGHSDFFYQWHREGFDLPDCVTMWATGSEHFPNQAYLYGRNAVGLQFHPEITRQMIDRWTMGAAHRLDRPGAQPRRAHLKGHELFDAGIKRWTEELLDFLGMPRLSTVRPTLVAEAAD